MEFLELSAIIFATNSRTEKSEKPTRLPGATDHRRCAQRFRRGDDSIHLTDPRRVGSRARETMNVTKTSRQIVNRFLAGLRPSTKTEIDDIGIIKREVTCIGLNKRLMAWSLPLSSWSGF